MNTNFLKLSVIALAAAAGLSAQSAEEMRLRVPFEFSVRGKVLPAGDYSVSRTIDSTRLVISSASQKNDSFTLFGTYLARISPIGASKLVFLHQGDAYILTEVWTGDGGRAVAPTKEERDFARQSPSGNVVIAATPRGK